MNILVNAWVRNMTAMVNISPDRHGTIPAAQQVLLRQIGTYMATYGRSVYSTRGGPWQPTDGKYGYTYKKNTFYVHLLPGYSGTGFTTPSLGDAQVTKVFDVATGTRLPYAVNADGTVTVAGINRTRHPEDSVVGVTLDRSVQPEDIAVHKKATASSEAKGYHAAMAFDGSTATRWAASNGRTGQWLQVDLGSTKSLTGARIAWELDATAYQYRIEGSTDKHSWTTLADPTIVTSTSQVQTAGFSAQARYVRVTITGLPTGVQASIRSLEVYDRPILADAGTFKLVNRLSGKLMDVNGASAVDGASVIQWPSTGGTNQQWTLLPNADGSYRLSNVRSGKVLDSPSSSAQNAALDQWADTGVANQSWQLVPSDSSGYYQLVNVGNGWCVDVANASTADGAKVVQSAATGGPSQDWQIVGL
jgi:alpha-L-fucosidase